MKCGFMMFRRWWCGVAMGAAVGVSAAVGQPVEVQVNEEAGLRAAMAAAVPGTIIRLAGGVYTGGFYFPGLRGEKDRPIVLEAAEAKNPPVFGGGATGLHLASPAFVELRGLVFTDLSANGVNIDDTAGGPAHHLVLKDLVFKGIGTDGNHDALKLSGVDDFRIMDSVFERWGTGGGSGIDMVGCHRGVIEGSTFRGTAGLQSNGVQAKGGSSGVAIRRNRFEQTGGRGVNLGGSTGRPFFRPPLTPGGENAEARELRVEGNTFVGTMAPVVFAGVDGAVVRFNTIDNPDRWAVRILQEGGGPDFVPCRKGFFTDNVIRFRSERWSGGGVNVGGGTAPETFIFARNWWHCIDRPDRSRPELPVPESDGEYGQGPDAGNNAAGAEAWKNDTSRPSDSPQEQG